MNVRMNVNCQWDFLGCHFVFQNPRCHPCQARFGWLVGNEEWKAAEASETWCLENLLRVKVVKDVGIIRGSFSRHGGHPDLLTPPEFIQSFWTLDPTRTQRSQREDSLCGPLQRRRESSARGFGTGTGIRIPRFGGRKLGCLTYQVHQVSASGQASPKIPKQLGWS